MKLLFACELNSPMEMNAFGKFFTSLDGSGEMRRELASGSMEMGFRVNPVGYYAAQQFPQGPERKRK